MNGKKIKQIFDYQKKKIIIEIPLELFEKKKHVKFSFKSNEKHATQNNFVDGGIVGIWDFGDA